jgi:hypothetical protein
MEVRLQENIEFKSADDFNRVITNFETLAGMLGKRMAPTTLFMIPFYSINDEIIFAATIMGQREYIRHQRGNRNFKDKEVLDCYSLVNDLLKNDLDSIFRNLSQPEMVAYALDISTDMITGVVKLHRDGVPYVTVTR